MGLPPPAAPGRGKAGLNILKKEPFICSVLNLVPAAVPVVFTVATVAANLKVVRDQTSFNVFDSERQFGFGCGVGF